MERELWLVLYRLLQAIGSWAWYSTTKYADAQIAAVYLWAVLHDRPVTWACDKKNWASDLWPQALPSQPTMSRRLHTIEVQRILVQLESVLGSLEDGSLVKLVDGKPQLVGSHSKDPDAAWGKWRRGYAKGYKLHAIYGRGPLPEAWDVVPLNEAEPWVAALLITGLRRGGGYLVGDKAYDSNPLHDTAQAMGCQLVAPQKRAGRLGHCRHSPGRLRSFALLKRTFGQQLMAYRKQVERHFGWLTNHSAGLAPLPNWVRRLPRVRLWIQAKLLIHAVYVYLHQPPPTLADE
jgi:hypothetical protein